jgi:Tol biopolymer transport system component
MINVDSTGQTKLTDMEGGACQPAWSPDGQRLAFISPCDSNRDFYSGSAIFVMNLDGSGLTPLHTVPGGDYDPTWSPDGKFIVFTSIRSSGRPEIYAYKLEDNSVKSLSPEYSRDMQPSYSPDGSKIIFVSERRGPRKVWIMDADGGNQEQLSHSVALLDTLPTFSPDGQMILFTQLLAANGVPRLMVALMSENAQKEYRLSKDPFPMREGRYSPDSFWIVLEGWPAGKTHNIYIMGSNGAGREQVTRNPRIDFDPAWRPGT